MKDADELRRMIDESWGMPHGAARVAVVEEAIRHADAFGDADLAFAARLAATQAYALREPAKMLVAFSWCVAEYSRDPGRRSSWEAGGIRFFFNHALVAMICSPAVPLDRIHALLDEMERIHQIGGHGMHCVFQRRWNLAADTGDLTAMEHWYDRWITADCDAPHDCDHIDLTMRVAHLSDGGRDEEAVSLGLPVLTGELSCTEAGCDDSSGVLTELMMPCLRTGRLTEAARAHRRAYRQLDRTFRERGAEISELDDLAANVYFCGVTGNEPRGLDMIERHLGSLEHTPSVFSEMKFAAAAALVLRRAAGLGRNTIRVGTEIVETAVLGERLAERATRIAARFDARNGTTYQGDRVAAWLTAEPLVDHLPIPSEGLTDPGDDRT